MSVRNMKSFREYLNEKFTFIDLNLFLKKYKLPLFKAQDFTLTGDMNSVSKKDYDGDLPGVKSIFNEKKPDVEVYSKLHVISKNIIPYIKCVFESDGKFFTAYYKYTNNRSWVKTTEQELGL